VTEAALGREQAIDSRPPAIPASRMEVGWLREVNLLLWVHTGSAQVEVDGGQTHRLAAGDGIWIPAGAAGRVTTDPGSVAFPYKVPSRRIPGAPGELVRFTVPDGWRDWLILHYGRDVVGTFIHGYSRDTLLDVLRAPGAAPRESAHPQGDQPPMPTADGARTVALELQASPGLGHSIEEWAALAACSVSTLRRGFTGTGLTFAQWRTYTRLAAACEFLAAGHDVEQTAALVGFASRNGFTRAFGDRYGITPREYAASAADPTGTPSARVAAARRSGALAHLIGETTALPAHPADPGPLPARHSPPHTNHVHVLSWIYRGETELRVRDTRYPNRQGDAIWIPAGLEHQYATKEDSLALPIGDLSPGDARINEPFRTHFPASWNAYLLHRTVATRTALRPDGFDNRDILDAFREQFALQRARTVPMPTDPRARAIATQFLRHLRTPPDAELDSAIHEAFWRETGLTFAHWRSTARMRTACDLLADGAKPSAVARRVGYTQVSNFSRAFRRFHGVSPSEYRRSAFGHSTNASLKFTGSNS
jgi:AraC-like DNA-binding protein/quercetin dioxygenase-like cupin family protein